MRCRPDAGPGPAPEEALVPGLCSGIGTATSPGGRPHAQPGALVLDPAQFSQGP